MGEHETLFHWVPVPQLTMVVSCICCFLLPTYKRNPLALIYVLIIYIQLATQQYFYNKKNVIFIQQQQAFTLGIWHTNTHVKNHCNNTLMDEITMFTFLIIQYCPSTLPTYMCMKLPAYRTSFYRIRYRDLWKPVLGGSQFLHRTSGSSSKKNQNDFSLDFENQSQFSSRNSD